MRVVYKSGNFQKDCIEARCEVDGVSCEFYSDVMVAELINSDTRMTLPLTVTQIAFLKKELRNQAIKQSLMPAAVSDERMEKLLNDKLFDFKSKLSQINEEALSNLYTDVLPYILSDTQFNMVGVIDSCLEKFIKGDFKVSIDKFDNYVIEVEDRNGFTHYIREHTDTIWGTIVAKIYDANPPACESAYIKQLECKVKSLEGRLTEAYRR